MKWWARDYIILPPKYLPDIKHADSDELSFLTNLSDVNQCASSRNPALLTYVRAGIQPRELRWESLQNQRHDGRREQTIEPTASYALHNFISMHLKRI